MHYDYELALQDVKDHIDGFRTRNYYSSTGGTEVIDLLRTEQLLEGFCIGNVMKYVARLGKKSDEKRSDIMKTFHYLVILLILEDPERYEVR